ncbi:PLP-dependent aminotransferase family protein [Sphaerisporangium sp. TRM90804]|uniref:aminotransferase-like domain-containing protein n=1 Tax=Sphaerisporangium sp. TRM90804 TaxID=3031113 RepID=UPI00244D7C8D|nr:PLP-dependent aminotransferase family protein [Sphaerisporangium sp. TRM90804]MDH2426095.1 PLP-dependent aminotransferase family protein [Sphaerisporangium sp. TRM90804]
MKDGSSVAQLAATLRNELNRYRDGEKLPSSRALVARHQVSPVTVSRAIATLTAEGLVTSRPGAGVFKAAVRRVAGAAGDVSWQEVALSADPPLGTVGAAAVLGTLTIPPPEVIDLNGGYLHVGLQPERALATALARAGRRPGTWSRPPVEGLAELRDWFARDIGGPGGSLSASDVLITAGGQSALTTALRALAAPGSAVLVESPTYPGMLAVARAAGLRPVPVPVDADGVRADLLAEAFEATRARVFVCQPLFHNPTGTVLSPQRRTAVLAVARAAGAFVVEDDFARRLAHAGSPPLPLPLAADDPDGVVVHVRSLTKAASPSLRIGALSARGPALERLRAVQVVDSLFVPRPLQETALELVGSPAWAGHLRALAGALRDRRTTMLTALGGALPALLPHRPPQGGYHLWLQLPDGADERAIVASALRQGVAVTAGGPYFTAEAPAPHLRLSYVATPGAAQLEEGVHRLRQALSQNLDLQARDPLTA